MRIQIQEELAYRLSRNFDRLEQKEYLPRQVFASTENNQQWPGDYPGRVILALVQLARTTGRQPLHLKAIIEGLSQHLNERGYLGQIMPDGIFDEQQLAGHGWLVAGLLAYYEWSKDGASLNLAQRIVRELYWPTLGYFSGYTVPSIEKIEGKHSGTRIELICNGWRLSTDVGCAFIALEGLVPACYWMDDAWLPKLIKEMSKRFAELDLVTLSAQTHATLTVARNLLAWHDQSGDSDLVKFAENLYCLYREQAMTENYANYNWFNRPEWTEPCAIVDSFVIAIELWKKTGRSEYLEEAQLIYYNALGYAQKPHGGFGCDCCVRGSEPELFNLVYDVTWCCNMRGAVGLAYAAQNAIFLDDASITLPFLFSFRAEGIEAPKITSIECLTGYPRDGSCRIKIQNGISKSKQVLRIFIPSWIDKNTVKLHIDGMSSFPVFDDSFLVVPIESGNTSEVALNFAMPLRQEPRPALVGIKRAYRLYRGPLILGERVNSDEKANLSTAQSSLSPLNDILYLTEAEARRDRRRVLFSEIEQWRESS